MTTTGSPGSSARDSTRAVPPLTGRPPSSIKLPASQRSRCCRIRLRPWPVRQKHAPGLQCARERPVAVPSWPMPPAQRVGLLVRSTTNRAVRAGVTYRRGPIGGSNFHLPVERMFMHSEKLHARRHEVRSWVVVVETVERVQAGSRRTVGRLVCHPRPLTQAASPVGGHAHPAHPRAGRTARQVQATRRSVTEIADLLGVSRAAMYRARSARRLPSTREDSAP